MKHNQISAICRRVLMAEEILAHDSDTTDARWNNLTFDFCHRHANQPFSEEQLITKYQTEVVKLIRATSISKIDQAIEIAVRYGGFPGIYHKEWVIDQMVRILAGDNYEKIVKEAKAGEEGPDTYKWSTGTAP